MLKKDNFFKSYFINSGKYYKNINKTKKIYNHFLKDLENKKIPLFESYQKGYELDFSKKMIKKFSKYKNIVLIGMGGSILGTKSIFSFLKNKIKKKVFFFDNLDYDLNLKYSIIKNIKYGFGYCFMDTSSMPLSMRFLYF